MKKRIVSLLLILALALLMLPGLSAPASAASMSFSDVKSGAWYYPYVMQLAQAGGVHGYPDGTFRPTATITRAEVASIAVNLFPPDQFLDDNCPEEVLSQFTQAVEKGLGANHWAKEAILKAYLCMGNLNYVDMNTWDQPATRYDIALIMARTYVFAMYGMGKLELPLPIPVEEEAALLIGDYDKIKGTEAEEDILWLYNEGIVSGINSRRDYNPQGTATRAECCTMAVGLLDPSKRAKVDWDSILSGSSTPTPSTSTTPSSGTAAEQMAARVVELVNQERAKQGLSPLSTMPSLTAAANIRAPELTILFSHDRPDGTQCFTALKQANVTYYTAGENIAAGQPTPEAVMDSWMNSSGHRANILSPNFTHIGVAYYNGCWVQMFIGKR